jgi:hypothetical protein
MERISTSRSPTETASLAALPIRARATGIRFVFPDNSEGLTPTVVTLEGYRMPKRDCAELHRRWNDLSCPQTIGEISRFARGDRESATTFSGVLDLLRRVVNGVRFRQRVGQRLSPDSVTKFGCCEIGRSGSSTSAAVSALSSRVKATLIVSTFSKAIADL